MCISTVVIDNEHLRLGSLALRAEEERKTDDSAKKKRPTKNNQQTQIQEEFLLWGYLRNVTFIRTFCNFG